MSYEYSGYLKTVLHKPDPSLQGKMKCISFDSDDFMRWTMRDRHAATEWHRIPVRRTRTNEGVKLEGIFNDVLRIDNLRPDDPRYWVPLGTLGWKNEKFPIDITKYPVVELTYRCISKNARPAWIWTYPGGITHDGLFPTHQWRTIARLVPHFGFPKQIDDVIFRLYTLKRSTESFEVKSLCFREMTPAEKKACKEDESLLIKEEKPEHYEDLNDFLPIGTYLNSESVRRLAKMLGISLNEYWKFAFEDIVRHSHNAISLSQSDRLSPEEFSDVLNVADSFGLKILASHDFPLGSTIYHQREIVDTYMKPHKNSDTILAWSLTSDPRESNLRDLLKAKELIAEVDKKHPVAIITQHPNAYPLFAPLFAVSGIGHASSHEPWKAGDIVRTHEPLSAGQHFWLTSPAFVYTTETPEWSSCPEMRLMVNQCFANGAKGWFTYRYHNEPIWVQGNCQRSLTGPFLTFSDLWEELATRVERYDAIAPLLLETVCDGLLKKWFVTSCVTYANSQVPDDVPAAGVFRLRGSDFNIYCLLSNDVRAMTSVGISIPDSSLKGQEIYDLSEFVLTWEWQQAQRKQHLEMFPGQMHMFFIAKPDVCARWRDIITERILQSTKRKLTFDLELTKKNGMNTDDIEKLMEKAAKASNYKSLATMRQCKDTLFNLMYSSEAICETRGKLNATSAALCGCDGVLCRMFGRGKADQSRELGVKTLPLAKELINLRKELHSGRGSEITHQCEGLAKRAIKLLNELRESN